MPGISSVTGVWQGSPRSQEQLTRTGRLAKGCHHSRGVQPEIPTSGKICHGSRLVVTKAY